MKFQWVRRPVPTPVTAVSVWEHTPLDPYKAEYPRFVRPVRNECRTEWVKRYEDGRIARPGEEPATAPASTSPNA